MLFIISLTRLVIGDFKWFKTVLYKKFDSKIILNMIYS